MAATTRDEVLAELRPGIDGLLLDAGYTRATFLPAVWEHIPTAEEFVGRLLNKAGLAWNAWPVGTRAYRYGAEEFDAPFPTERTA
jgi:AMMECR1 domain-containing protein